jgi:hypothetical protein
MANKDITKELLLTLFDYKNGCLYWKAPAAHNVKIGDLVNSGASERYLRVMVNSISYKVHRLVFLMHYGYLPKYIDHINGNTKDNRIENLREASYCQNNQNASIRKDSSSGIKGVYWHKPTKKWTASCQVNKKRHHLGCFDDIKAAENAVKLAREQYHGEFARHN